MPLLKLQTSVSVSEGKRQELLKALSGIVTECIGKPEQYVMVTITQGPIMMSGEQNNAAFVDVRSIGGLNRDVNLNISRKVCSLLDESLGISPEKVYINFWDIPAGNWGWNGKTFGS